MLVDLGRNDLGKSVSWHRSGGKTAFCWTILPCYAHYLGSTVRVITEKHDTLDAIEAVLPAGTLSGAPKIGLVSLSENLKTTSGELWRRHWIHRLHRKYGHLYCGSYRLKNGKVFVRAELGSWQIPYLKRSMKNASTKPDPHESVETCTGGELWSYLSIIA